MVTFIAEKARYPELRAEFERAFVGDRRAHMQRIFRAAVERGDLPRDTDVDLIAEAGPAMLVHRYLLHGGELDPTLPKRIVELLLPSN